MIQPEYADNIWTYAFLFVAPVFVFAGWRSWPLALTRAGAAVMVGWYCYVRMVDQYWALRIKYLPPTATTQEAMDATADGANRVFSVVLGWLVYGIYVALWFAIYTGIRGAIVLVRRWTTRLSV